MTSEKTNLLTSLKRTLIPILVGVVGASFLGGYIDNATLDTFLSGLISALYYTVVRFVETKWPEAGVLLGAKYQPVYTLVDEPEE